MDGRDGQVCIDCGAYLQPVPVDGVEVLRCPWAQNYERAFRDRDDPDGVLHIFCNKPIAQRSTSVVASYSAPNHKVNE
jgi:hypothetical protein